MLIGIGCDHTALSMKEAIMKHLGERGFETRDYGVYSPERSNYPEIAEKVGRAVAAGECGKGIVICGTGVGIGIAANKIPGIRCAICSEPYSAVMSRRHNNANMLALGARVIGEEAAKMIADMWLDAEYEGGRHQIRVDMLAELDGRRPEHP